jgi:hypothetical protein
LVIETVTPSVPLNQSNVSQYTRNRFDFGRVVSKRDGRMVGGLFKNISEKQKKSCHPPGFFLVAWF